MSSKAKDRSNTSLVIRVVEIRGDCPVYKLGDRIASRVFAAGGPGRISAL